jgi:hypothetical protein
MTDYEDCEYEDVVGIWLEDMSSLYKAYRACLKYGSENGTPRKALEAQQYQGVRCFCGCRNVNDRERWRGNHVSKKCVTDTVS